MKKRLKNSIISIALALMMVVTYTPLAGITGIGGGTAEAATRNIDARAAALPGIAVVAPLNIGLPNPSASAALPGENSGNEARINGKTTSLIDAYSIAQDTPGVQTITILKDMTNPKWMHAPNGKEVIFDLNGHTITSDVDYWDYGIKYWSSICVGTSYDDSKATYKNGTVNGIVGTTGGQVTLENMTINGAVYVYDDTSKLYFKSGTINGRTLDGPSVVIDWGLFEATGGEITAESGQYCIEIGNTNDTTLKLSGSVKLTGNAITGSGSKIEITGGTFSDQNVEKYLTGTYVLKDGKVAQGTPIANIGNTGYLTLDKAVKAAKSGDTIKLTANASNQQFTVSGGKKITLDLNGKTLSMNYAAKTRPANNYDSLRDANDTYCITLSDKDTELNITDSTGRNTGAINGLIKINAGKVNVKGGTLSTSIVCFSKDAVINQTGGIMQPTSSATNGEPVVDMHRGGTYNYSGGTLKSGDTYAIYNRKGTTSISGEAVINQGALTTVGKTVVTGGYFGEFQKNQLLTLDFYVFDQDEYAFVEVIGGKPAQYHVVGAERASIGGTKYSTLKKAFEAAKDGDTIKVLEDMSGVALAAPGNKKITLDLNGHKLTGANKANCTLEDFAKSTSTKLTLEVNVSTAELTVTDSSAAKTGTIDGAVGVKNGKFTLTDGKITGGVYMTSDDAVLNIKGGEVSDKWATLNYNAGTVNITGGTVFGGTGTSNVICMQNSDKAKLNISGSATIEGGNFVDVKTPFSKGNIQITGGYYKDDTIKNYLTDDYALVSSTSRTGYYQVLMCERAMIGTAAYPSLKKALEAAAIGDTIKILEDMELNVTVSKEVTIDLSKHVITAKGSLPAITVGKGGNLTLTSSSSESKDGQSDFCGVIKKGKGKYAVVNEGGKLNIEKGNYEGLANSEGGAKTKVSGGYVLDTIASVEDAEYEISGGWFPKAVPEDYVADGLYPSNLLEGQGIEGARYTVGHKITLDLNYEGSGALWTLVGPVTGFKINQPNTPYREEYIFQGWFADSKCTTAWNFNTVIKENTTIYAKWRLEDPWKDNCPGNCKHEVAVGTRHYKTLKDAIANAASGSEIVLLKDIEAAVLIPTGKSFTIDLKGFTIGPAAANAPIIENKGTLVVNDTNGGKGRIAISKMNGSQVAIENYEGNLTINAGMINNANPEISTISNKGGTLTINGGVVNSEQGYAIYNGASVSKGGVVNVTGGEVNAATMQAIWTMSSNYVTVSGGKVYAGRDYAIQAGGYDEQGKAWNGYVTINGGQIISRASGNTAAAILNFAGTVNIDANAKDNDYPQIVGRIPLISNSRFTHANNISGGWFSSKLGTDDPATKFAKNGVALYPTDVITTGPTSAKYTLGLRITLDYNYADSKPHYVYALLSDGTIPRVADPVRPGYVFNGWYKEKSTITPFDIKNTKVNNNMTLYAKWAAGAQLGIMGQKIVVGDYLLTIKPVREGGALEVTPLGGNQVRLDFIPMIGYKAGSLFIDGDYVNAGYDSYNLNIKADTTVSGTFKPSIMTAEEYRLSVEQDKYNQEQENIEQRTVTSGDKETRKNVPGEAKDKGGPRTSGEEYDYDDPGNGKGEPAHDEKGDPYSPGTQYEKEILSGGGGDVVYDGKQDKESWFYFGDAEEMGYDGKDSSGWIYIGEDIEKYIPAESDLEHIDRIDQSLPVEEQKAQAKDILNMLTLNAKSGLAISPKGKSAVKIVWYDEKYSLDVLDGVETFRSTKKSEGYGKKPMLSSVTGRYFNTAIEDGQKYYYKVRGYIKIDGERYYTDWSDVISQVAKRFVIVAPNRQVIKSSNSPEKAKLKVTLQKQTGMTKYEIRYSMTDTKVESKYGTVTMTNNKKYKGTQSKTFSSSKYIKSGKYVYVKARGVYTKPNGTTGYTPWSKVMKVKIR